MSYLNDRVFDNGLTVLDTEVNRLDICSAEPSTYDQATNTLSLGNKLSPNVGAPGDRTPSGRKVTVAAITDGEVTVTGTASHYALSDTSNSRLLAAGPLASSQSVTDNNVFTLTTFDIGIPDPA